MPPAEKFTTGRRAVIGNPLDEVIRGLKVLGRTEELLGTKALEPCDPVTHRAHVTNSLDDVAGPRLAFGANHRRTFAETAERLAEVTGTAYEGHVEVPLVDVVLLVGGREDFGLVDVVDAEGLKDLRLNEMPDAALRHDRHRDGLHDFLDPRGVGHTGHATCCTDVGGNALERHDGDGAGVLGDFRLLGVHDVHDDAALEHFGKAGLDAKGSSGRAAGRRHDCRYSSIWGHGRIGATEGRCDLEILLVCLTSNNHAHRDKGHFIVILMLGATTWNHVFPGANLMTVPSAALNAGGALPSVVHVPSKR